MVYLAIITSNNNCKQNHITESNSVSAGDTHRTTQRQKLTVICNVGYCASGQA